MQRGQSICGAWEVIDLVQALTAALDAKSSYTRGHSDRVAELSWSIAREAGLAEREAEAVRIAGHLHDIGKIGIPDSIICKPGCLAADEFATMKRHTVIGSSLVEQVVHLQVFAPAVRGHHERWDGSGYPDGLAGEAIPVDARIICIADSYDAMTSARSYRARLEAADAIGEIRRCAGTQFDPTYVAAFERLFSAGELPLLLRIEELVGDDPVMLSRTESPA
jgi:HD-GYP domain-containing protein (c-di-GMP phosphodiesterase class II)